MKMPSAYLRLLACLTLAAVYTLGDDPPFIYYWNCGPDVVPNSGHSCRTELNVNDGFISVWADVNCSNDVGYSHLAVAGADNCSSAVHFGANTARLGTSPFQGGSFASAFAPCGSSYIAKYCDGSTGTFLPGCVAPC
jgi:hypothetical protein